MVGTLYFFHPSVFDYHFCSYAFLVHYVNSWAQPIKLCEWVAHSNYWSCDCKSWSVALNVNYLILQSLHQNYGNFACGKSVTPKSTLRLQLQLKLKPEVLIVCMKNWCGKDESFWSGQMGEGFGFLSSKRVLCQIFPNARRGRMGRSGSENALITRTIRELQSWVRI
jgi:hypothetical protein